MKDNFNNTIRKFILVFIVLGTVVAQTVFGQKSAATQIVTLQVMELNKIDLVGGPLTLQIGSVNDGSAQPDPAIDASTKLSWTSNGEKRKIAVGSNIASPRFVLKIEAEKSGNGSGTAEPQVTLSDDAPHDLIVGVERSSGSCTLRFTALAKVEAGIGSEQHLITYTITGS